MILDSVVIEGGLSLIIWNASNLEFLHDALYDH